MILGIIPARGGSKGIQRKNMAVVGEKPLIEWTIGHAKSSKFLDHFLVTTEDSQIGRFSEGKDVEWWKRPPELATDEASTLSVLEDVVTNYPKDISAVVVLQPTSPIRSEKLIDTCIKFFLNNNLDSIATGFMDKDAPYGEFQHYRRQDYKGKFCDDGNVYVIKASLIKNKDRIGKRFGGLVISKEENMEIDDVLDLKKAELLIKNPLNGDKYTGLKKGSRYDFLSLHDFPHNIRHHNE